MKIKLKATCQEEGVQKRKELIKNLVGKSPTVSNKPIVKIINNQVDIRLAQFKVEELDLQLTKIETRKDKGLDEMPPEVWTIRKFNDVHHRQCNAVYKENTMEVPVL